MRTVRKVLTTWLIVATALAVPGLAVVTPAGAATHTTTFDYTQVEGLSQPVYPETVTTSENVPVTGAGPLDGAELYVEVTRPDPDVHGNGPWPVVLEASPYHGTLADREGTRIFPDPRDDEENMIGLTGYFAQRGYAVVMVDLRGTGRSSGCLDHLGPNDASDLKQIVEWAADEPWSNGRVGMTGHSYVGSTPSVAAAQDPDGLVTIAPSAGLASMYDHQFQYGVPYLLQWVGPMFAYEQLSVERHAPGGDNFGGPPPEPCTLQHSSLASDQGQVTGQYDDTMPMEWHARRDYRADATAADIPVFMIHGVNDNAARIPAAEWFFGNRFNRPGDKVWVGQWDHGSSANTTCPQAHPNCRFEQWQYALHAWFDKHLAQRDVDTGPAVEAFLNGEVVYTANRWRRPNLEWLYPHHDRTLRFERPAPGDTGTVSFTTTPGGGGSTEFVSAPVENDTLLLGLPQQELIASLAGDNQVFHLVTTLYNEAPDGERLPMNYCAIQPSLRDSPHTRPTSFTPIPPGEPMDLEPQCFTMAHHLPAGHKLVLEVGTSSPHHVTGLANPFAPDEVTIHTGRNDSRYRLPINDDFSVLDDVDIPVPGVPEVDIPDAPAQPPVCGDVTVPMTGGEIRVDGVTVEYFEFDSLPQHGNASFEVVAKPATPADVDLFLQRQEEDGSWSEDLNASGGGSFDFEQETLTYQRPVPGRYRVGVVNWAGQPALDVEVCVTFFDAAGNAGVAQDDDKPDRPGSDAPPGADDDPDRRGSDRGDSGARPGKGADDATDATAASAPVLPATGGGAAAAGLALLIAGALVARRRQT